LAPNAAHVHGLDISREMIRIANGKAQTQGVEEMKMRLISCIVLAAFGLDHRIVAIAAVDGRPAGQLDLRRRC